MTEAPTSYLNCRRPPLREALLLEGGMLEEATEALRRKGYFTAPPRPWQLGGEDRGMGRMGYAILDKFGDLVVTIENREIAEFIILAANAQG